MNDIPHEDFVNTSVISDLLHMREYPDLSLFTSVKLNSILENMCVNWNLFSYRFCIVCLLLYSIVYFEYEWRIIIIFILIFFNRELLNLLRRHQRISPGQEAHRYAASSINVARTSQYRIRPNYYPCPRNRPPLTFLLYFHLSPSTWRSFS